MSQSCAVASSERTAGDWRFGLVKTASEQRNREDTLHPQENEAIGDRTLPVRLRDAMSRYQQADPDAAEELVGLINPILFRFLLTLPNTAANIDDLLQECWLRIHRARHSYRPGEPVLPWVFSIARHVRVDHYRRAARHAARESGIEEAGEALADDPRPRMEAAIDARAALRLLRRLPDGQREVLLMMKVTGMSIEEVAQATGSTVPAVKQKAWPAYENMRRWLKERDEESGNGHAVRGS